MRALATACAADSPVITTGLSLLQGTYGFGVSCVVGALGEGNHLHLGRPCVRQHSAPLRKQNQKAPEREVMSQGRYQNEIEELVWVSPMNPNTVHACETRQAQ